jgi:LmbE family N-acetylglucosaminyl deacetylase
MPEPAIDGPVLVLAPHSDDEALGCGGVIARLAPKTAVHVLYATDGRLSPAGPDGGPAPDADALVADRRAEAEAAMALLGVPADQLRFLGLRDGGLSADQDRLEAAVAGAIDALRPRTVFAPFRHDQHPDHLAMHRAAVRALARSGGSRLLQYFVYYRYPFLLTDDIRRAVAERHLLRVDVATVRTLKRRALDLYVSQTTRRYPWQSRPILTEVLLESRCLDHEIFAEFDPAAPDAEVFGAFTPWLWATLRFGPEIVRLKKRLLG